MDIVAFEGEFGAWISYAPSLWDPSDPASLPPMFLPKVLSARAYLLRGLFKLDYFGSPSDTFNYVPAALFSVGVELIFPDVYRHLMQHETDQRVLQISGGGVDTAKEWKTWDSEKFHKLINFVSSHFTFSLPFLQHCLPF